MSILGFFVLLIVAAIIGSIGSSLGGYSTQGCFASIIVGLIGALIGSWLSRELGIPDFLYLARIPVFWSIIGAAIFVAIIAAINPQQSKRRKK
ncbi:GlsB/YeaQ/YmgE family stress response membrane protein [candidate division KSB1 bacterium]|nr:GlsB/YeaQ/YmgE family stress response membrane protein [candidate division KSB1 bacterium]